MKFKWFAFLALALIAGCSKPPEVKKEDPPVPPGASQGSQAGVTPIGPPMGSLTPVTGDVGGTTGGGVGQAAKNQAKNAAAMAGGSTATPPPDDGDGGQ